MDMVAISEYERPGLLHTHHIEDGSRFLYPESLHHLEDVHHSLCLAALNGGCYGTEHPRATYCVTAVEERMKYIVNGSYATGRIRRHGQFVKIKVQWNPA